MAIGADRVLSQREFNRALLERQFLLARGCRGRSSGLAGSRRSTRRRCTSGLLEGATHCFVAATVTRGGRDPVGRLLGDCPVLLPSASGRSGTRRIPFEEEYGAHIGGTHHLALLNHPRVYERMLGWL